jgi:hypothetical protein
MRNINNCLESMKLAVGLLDMAALMRVHSAYNASGRKNAGTPRPGVTASASRPSRMDTTSQRMAAAREQHALGREQPELYEAEAERDQDKPNRSRLGVRVLINVSPATGAPPQSPGLARIPQAPEIARRAHALIARPALEWTRFDGDEGQVQRAPGRPVYRQCRAEHGHDRHVRRGRDVHRATVAPDEQGCAIAQRPQFAERQPAAGTTLAPATCAVIPATTRSTAADSADDPMTTTTRRSWSAARAAATCEKDSSGQRLNSLPAPTWSITISASAGTSSAAKTRLDRGARAIVRQHLDAVARRVRWIAKGRVHRHEQIPLIQYRVTRRVPTRPRNEVGVHPAPAGHIVAHPLACP